MYYYKSKKKKRSDEVEEKNVSSAAASSKVNYSQSVFILASMFLAGVAILYLIYLNFPQLEESEKQWIKLPMNIDDAKNLGRVLKKYNQDHFYSVVLAFFCTYIFLQTFAIPGSIFLTILSGFLFPFPFALTLVCTCSTIGAGLCYIISHLAARRIVLRLLKSRLSMFQQKVEAVKSDLFWYIVFLRVTPFLPNWFINLASPVINVPWKPFVFGTFVGVAPPSLIYIQAGTTLNTLASSASILSLNSFLGLALVALVALLPIILPKLFPKWWAKFAPSSTVKKSSPRKLN